MPIATFPTTPLPSGSISVCLWTAEFGRFDSLRGSSYESLVTQNTDKEIFLTLR